MRNPRRHLGIARAALALSVGCIAAANGCTCSEQGATGSTSAKSPKTSAGVPAATKKKKNEDEAGSEKKKKGDYFRQLTRKQRKYHANSKGRFRRARPEALGAPTAETEIERLEALGYAGGTVEAPPQTGTTVHDEERAQPGYNFYTSGHGTEAILMDMDGDIIHRWSKPFLDVWPKKKKAARHRGAKHWRRARLLRDGSVLAIYEGKGIIKVDPDSKLVWSNARTKAHHDLHVLPNGNIMVLGRKAHRMPSLNEKKPITEDFVIELGPNGKEKRRVSLIECWKRSDYDFWRKRARRRGGDFFHTNTLHVLDEEDAAHVEEFDAGDVLISAKRTHNIAVVDLEERKVVWSHRGRFKHQHDPKILENGNLMLFDNRGKTGRSAVLEYELPGMRLVWSYRGSREHPFYSHTCGASSLLPNGNILVTETDAGRAFELTRDKEIVWELYNPERAGDEDQYIATLSEVQRIPKSFPLHWADNPPDAD